MNTQFRRILSVGVSLLALAPGLASNVTPAMAAGKVVVDDDKVQCPKATFTNIQAAVNSLGPNPTGKITVCAGTYPGMVIVLNANKLKLIAKPGVVVKPAILPFNATLLNVITSTNVTVQGFTFDGQSNAGTGGSATALQFSESSGTIQKNTIQNWHTPGYATSSDMKAIYLTNGLGQTVKVMKNTITDFQGTGIFAEGLSVLNIGKNTLSTPAVGSADSTIGISLGPVGPGAPSGVIKGNKLTSDTVPAYSASAAMYLNEAGDFKISGNTLSHWTYGIYIMNSCTYPTDTDNIKVSGNKVLETYYGIYLSEEANGCDTHADNFRVTGNKITTTLVVGGYGIVLDASGSGGGHAYALNALIKGNKITHFTTPLYNIPGTDATVTGVFAPNTVVP